MNVIAPSTLNYSLQSGQEQEGKSSSWESTDHARLFVLSPTSPELRSDSKEEEEEPVEGAKRTTVKPHCSCSSLEAKMGTGNNVQLLISVASGWVTLRQGWNLVIRARPLCLSCCSGGISM